MERLDSLITGKNLPESARNASERLRTASEWAERQVLRASKLVRSSTIPTPLSQTEISQQVQNSDGGFFEQFLAPTSDEMKVPDETTGSNDGKLFIKKLSLNADDTRMEDLYVEVLYTIKHRVGLPNGVSNEQLIQYAQRAFGITGREHDRLMNRAKQEKPPIVLLNVLLLEARDLIAKDVNGFSDPFTMMGVVPGNRRQSITSVQSTRVGTTTNGREVDKSKESENFNTLQGAQTDDQTKSKSPILTEHFGGSFRRKIGGNDGTLRNHDKDGRQIPAKLIKASSVQRKTLNPKWNEKFQFVVDDVSTDYFHMDIWDHDDEDQSVIDAVTSLNHVSGFKGLGRYFKEVAQSARTETDECSDDFLGCITIKIEDLPSVGIEDWFSLEKRSDRSEVSGQVKLKLWLSTREERNEFDDDDLLDVKQHIELIRVFALFEISQAGMPVSAYMGTLPETALTILHQHSVQGDLTVLHDLLCSWMAYSSMLNIDISYHFLHTILAELINKWAPLILNKDAEDMLGDSFTSFDSHCRTAIINHRQRFRADHRDELESLAEMLRCLKLMRESWLFEKCLPLQRSFEATISAQIELSAGEYFKKALKSATNKDPCGQLESLLLLLNSACAKFPAYNPIFTSIASVDYASIAYSQFDRMLVEYLCSELMSEDAEKLKCSLLRATKMEDDDLRSLSTLIKIHFALTDFYGFRNSNQKLRKEDGQWGIMFDKAISRWVDAVRVRAFARADLACHLDTPIQSTADIRQSSSYVDVCRMIDMIVQAWSRMKVTDSSLWFDLCFKVVQDICKICEYYVDKILAQLATEGFCGELQMFIPAALLCIFCSTINNIEQVRRSVSIHHKLRFDELVSQFESTCHHSATWKMEIESEIDECDKYMSDQIDATIERLTGRLIPTLKKHVFHLAWSPTACAVESAIKPLTDIKNS
ncbi:hypothetical protein AB6A40_000668 [Gnathostoma spinigerum]|uniref:C2 domain-containing protein n=1 Tax=Gnathostoma spinigerum TaxID=75299 RepID=A0ABD6E720_9BILA